jgi:hypothetical protein
MFGLKFSKSQILKYLISHDKLLGWVCDAQRYDQFSEKPEFDDNNFACSTSRVGLLGCSSSPHAVIGGQVDRPAMPITHIRIVSAPVIT